MDTQLRRLEKKAASGDEIALQRLVRAEMRINPPYVGTQLKPCIHRKVYFGGFEDWVGKARKLAVVGWVNAVAMFVETQLDSNPSFPVVAGWSDPNASPQHLSYYHYPKKNGKRK